MTDLPTIRSQTDVLEVWRRLMQPLGFGGPSIWMLHVDPDGEPVPAIVEITATPCVPDESGGFVELLRELDADVAGGSFAFLRSRPGRGIEQGDRAWAAFLYDAGRAAGVRLEVVHLATDVDVVPLPLDEVGVRRTA